MNTRPTHSGEFYAPVSDDGAYLVTSTRRVPGTVPGVAPHVLETTTRRDRKIRRAILGASVLISVSIISILGWVVWAIVRWISDHIEAIVGGIAVLVIASVLALRSGGSGYGYHWTRCK